MAVSQDGYMQELLQRLLTGMDFIEHNLVRHSIHETSELRSTVGRIQRARRLETEGLEDSRPQAMPSHRGPGALASTPARAPEEVITAQFIEAAQAAASEQQAQGRPVQSVDPHNPFAIGAGSARPSPAPRKAFTNTLVKSLNNSATTSPVHEVDLQSPPPP